MVEAATSYRKNGFNDDDAAQLAQISAMFQNVADETISAADAADFIISQLIAFNQTSGDVAANATHIVDSINEVANSFSVSSGDLSQGLSVVASSSAAMGNSLEETIGLMTSITEQTRSASKASRGLNTIMANLAQVLDSSSSNGEKIKQIYSDLGIAMNDSNGQLKSGYELLSDLAGKWNTLDGNTQKYIATTIAGTTQLNNFLALMNNFDHAVEATETALNSQGSALKENSAYMESLEAKTNNLKATFQDLANNVIDNELVGGLLDLADAVLRLANTDIGNFVTQVLLLTSIGWGTKSLLEATNILSVVIAQFKELGAAISLLKSAKSIGDIFSLISMSGGATLPILLGISAAIVGIVAGVKAWKEANPSLEEATQKLDSLNTQLQTNEERLEEINKLEWHELTEDILVEKAAIEEENEELERNLELYKKRQLKAAEKERNAYGTISSDEVGYSAKYNGKTYYGTTATGEESFGYLLQQLSVDIPEAAEATREEFERLGVVFDEYNKQVSVTSDEYNQYLITSMQDYINQLNTSHSINKEQVADFTELKAKVAERAEALILLMDNNVELLESESQLIALYEQLTKAEDAAREATNLLSNGVHLTRQAYNELIEKCPQLKSSIKEVDGELYLNAEALGEVKLATEEETNAMYNAIAAQTIFNNTSLDIRGKIEAMYQLATAIGATGQAYDDLNQIMARSPDDPYYGAAMRAFTAKYGNLESLWDEIRSGGTGGSVINDVVDNVDDVATRVTQTVDAQLEKLKDVIELRESELALLEAQGAPTEQQVAKQREIQAALHDEAEYLRSINGDQAEINGLSAEWWNIQNEIASTTEEIGNSSQDILSTTEEIADETDYILEQLKSDVDLRKSELSLLEAQDAPLVDRVNKQREIQSALESEISYLQSIGAEQTEINSLATEWYQIQKDIVNAQKEALDTLAQFNQEYASREIDALQEQIDGLEDIMDSINDKYDAQLEALEKQNDAIDRQIQLKKYMDALEKAKSTKIMVYKDGMFQYVEDTEAVAKAQEDLDTYRRQLAIEEQKDFIEQQRKLALEEYEMKIEMLRKQIKIWEDYSDGWEQMVDDYEYSELALAALQAEALLAEDEMWQERLANLKSFASQYNATLATLGQGVGGSSSFGSLVSCGSSSSSGGSYSSSSSGVSGEPYDYNDGVDYGQKILESESLAEALAWAQQRENAAEWRGEDISGDGEWESNQELLKELYLKNPELFTGAYNTTEDYGEAYKSFTDALYSADSAMGWAEAFGVSQDAVKDALSLNTNQTMDTVGGTVSADEARANKLEQIRLLNEQIAANSEAWFDADEETRVALHEANERYRALVAELEAGLDDETVGSNAFKYALGTTSAHGGISLVGEQGPELRVLNNGDGIIPADVTRNLWDWGKMNPKSMSLGSSHIFNISNLSLPSVKTPEQFIDGLKNLAIQRAYSRT